MPKSKKKRTDDRTVEKVPASKAIDRDLPKRWTGFVIASVVIVLIAIIVGVSLYLAGAPFRHTIITVDDTSISMDYFLKRARLTGSDPMSMLGELTDELVIKLEAPRFVGEVTPKDIDQGLRIIASGGSGNITESEFKEWYRQQLNETGLSDSEFKEYVATSLLAARLHEYLAERVPTVAEQVHLHVIVLETSGDAEKTRERWKAGEDFADLAREVSLDEQLKETGGDMGWFPRGVLPGGIEDAAFSLNIGEVSEPVSYIDPLEVQADPSQAQEFYYLLMVSEKAAARQLDENPLQALKSRALDTWLAEERQLHKIGWHGLKNGFDSYTDAWIKFQLAKSNTTSSTSQQQTQQ